MHNRLTVPRIARQRRRAPAAKPGQVDRGVFQRGLAVQQVTPGFDGGLGLLDVFEKFEFGVIAAPAPALEQFGEVFQPLLGKVAPARNDVAAARHVCRKCHKSARMRETDADATETNQFDVTRIFCGKLSRCPVREATDDAVIEEIRTNTELSSLFTVKLHGSMAVLRGAPR